VDSEGGLMVSLNQAGGRVPGLYICSKGSCVQKSKAKVYCIRCIQGPDGGTESWFKREGAGWKQRHECCPQCREGSEVCMSY
jgi:hypothetical protein